MAQLFTSNEKDESKYQFRLGNQYCNLLEASELFICEKESDGKDARCACRRQDTKS